MPNQLSIPFKRTYVIPIREAVREYILSHYADAHPDAYRWDIGQWEKLRAEATTGVVHIDRVNALIRCDIHNQVAAILGTTHFLKLSCAACLHTDKTTS